jgi:hypothetical protein
MEEQEGPSRSPLSIGSENFSPFTYRETAREDNVPEAPGAE